MFGWLGLSDVDLRWAKNPEGNWKSGIDLDRWFFLESWGIPKVTMVVSIPKC